MRSLVSKVICPSLVRKDQESMVSVLFHYKRDSAGMGLRDVPNLKRFIDLKIHMSHVFVSKPSIEKPKISINICIHGTCCPDISVIKINMTTPYFKPGKKNYERVKWCLTDRLGLSADFICLWKPHGNMTRISLNITRKRIFITVKGIDIN